MTELAAAWRPSLEAARDAAADAAGSGSAEAGAAPAGAAPAGAAAALDRLVDEVGRIVDPHRAIDWLSTFPQVALLAVGRSG